METPPPLSQTTESGSGFKAQSQALEDLRRRLSDPAQAAEAAEMLRQTNVLSWLAAAPEFGAFVRSCAAAGRADVLERAALAAPGCVDAADARGRTALHSAARNGHLVTLNRLLDWGADPRAVTRNGNSCLHAVAKRSVVPRSRRAHHPPQSAAEVLDAIRAKATAAAAYVQHRLSSSSTSSSSSASPAIAEESAAAAAASTAIEDWEEDDDDSSSASPAPQLSFVRSWSTSMVRFPLSSKQQTTTSEEDDGDGEDEDAAKESGSKESRRIEQLDSEGALADAKPKLEELIHFTVHRLCKVLDASAPNRAGWTPLRLAIDRGNEPVAASLRECGAKLGDEPVAVSGDKCCGGEEGVDIVEVQHDDDKGEESGAAPAVQQETEAAKAISAATASIAKFAQSVAVQGQGIVRRLRTSQKTVFLNKVREILDSEPRRRLFSRVPDPFPSSTGSSAGSGAGEGGVEDRTRKYRIIALDGGGVRCVMHCILLARIARRFPSFLENTEMLCGCSGASVLPILLQCGLSVEQVGRLMELSAEWTLKKAAGNGITGMRFSAKWLRMMCDLIMGDLRLADLPRHVVIPAYRLDNGREGFARKGEAAFLTNAVPAAGGGGEERAVDACLRSGSAPTYFNSYQGFVDGGIFANNPSMCGLPLAVGSRPAGLQVPVTNVVCLSLGTGRAQAERFVERHKVAGGGLAQWGTSLMDVLDAAQLDYAEVSGRALLGSRFFRLTPELQGTIKLDDVNAIPALKATAEKVDIAEMLSWVEQNWF